MIPTLMNDGTVQNLVFDPTFTLKGAAKPLPLAKWIQAFVFPNAECPLIENIKDFEEHQEQYYCYTMLAPMYNYLPQDFEEDASGTTGWQGNGWYDPSTHVRKNWRSGDLLEMENSIR